MEWLKPKWQRSNPASRLGAIAETSDQNILKQLARHDPAAEVRQAAIQKVADETVLLAAVMEDAKMEVRLAALPHIKSQTLLLKIFLKHKTPQIRLAALALLENEEVLAEALEHETEAKTSKDIVAKISKEQILVGIATTHALESVRLEALCKLKKEALIEQVLGMAHTDNLLNKALSLLSEQKVAQIAQSASHSASLRKLAIQSLHSPKLLEDLVMASNDPVMVHAAIDRLADFTALSNLSLNHPRAEFRNIAGQKLKYVARLAVTNKSYNSVQRQQVVKELGALCNANCLPALLLALKGQEGNAFPEVARAAAQGLSWLALPEALEALAAELFSDRFIADKAVQNELTKAIGMIGGQAAISLLTRIQRGSPVSSVREQAAFWLEKIASEIH